MTDVNVISKETQRTIYWIEQALNDLRNGCSAINALSTAINHAAWLDRDRMLAIIQSIPLESEKIFDEAKQNALAELEEDNKGE